MMCRVSSIRKASMERRQSSSSTPPQSLEPLNVTYEKNNSTLCIASDGPLNSTFTLDEGPELSPPTRQNSKFAKNCLPDPPITYNPKLSRFSDFGFSSKLSRNQVTNFEQNTTVDKNQLPDPSGTPQNSKFIPEPSTVTQNLKFGQDEVSVNSKFTRGQSPEPSALGYSSKFGRNHSPEPSPFCQNSKFLKKPLSESTPLVKNSRFTANNHHNHEGDDLDEVVKGMNGDMFSNSLKDKNDDIMNISFPSMMQSSTSLLGDSETTFDANPNTTVDKKRSSFGAGRLRNTGQTSLDEDVSPNLTVDKTPVEQRRLSEVNPSLTTEKRRISLGRSEPEVDPDRTIESRRNFEVNPNVTVEKGRLSEVNPNLTIEKGRTSLEHGRYSTTSEESNVEVNPNATYDRRRSSNLADSTTSEEANFQVNPNGTFDRRRSSNLGKIGNGTSDPNLDNFEVDPNRTIERSRSIEVESNGRIENPNTSEKVNNSEVNPYLTIDKRKSTIGAQMKSSSTENVIVNNLNAKYQECLKHSERIQALRDRLEEGPHGAPPSQNLSQITPPHNEDFLGEPVSFSTPSRGVQLQKSKIFTNGCSEDSCEEISPVSVEDSPSPRASSVPPLDGTFCKSRGEDSFTKKGPKRGEGGASPLNSTFRKQALSSTFCKSAETLNNGVGGGGGSVESGPEEDGMSTASDSSFSSSSTHMRSVGEIQSIARLQEESLSLQNNPALRKIAWGGSDSGDGDLTKGNQTVFRKQTMSDDGNHSDHSERCSPSSERSSPTALNNNLRNVSRLQLKPLSSYRTGGLSMQHARSVEQLPSGMSLARTKQSTFGLKRPTVVSRQSLHNTTTSFLPQQQQQQQHAPSGMAPPLSRLQAPSATAPTKPSGIRPPTAIPRPVSRLPAPKIKTGLPRYNGKSSGQS
ncbi:uncharacterized protein LOC111051568 isoform X3 [Nilaparvata lugens]|uniref:uncharacterized protein LOC111051568 isoform X3 n=1 Tax=Nilaparvata lugens TaxID=108931 RepID=UPI00193EA3C2|nr:uncharacterized protein LOC111051568 isoform X3 [Nilaparvata lugens]